MANNVIIVAGGKGLRMGSQIPKQFLSIKGEPILMRSIKAFYNFDNLIHIIVVLHPSYNQYWSGLCDEYNFKIPHSIVKGGDSRFQSVKNGLALVNDGFVAVHDGARPIVSLDLVKRSFEAASKYSSAIPVIPITDSVRYIDNTNNSSKIVDRNEYKLVQTPQVFEAKLLKDAYEVDFNNSFTDDASVVEFNRHIVHLIDGEKDNIKITTPFDLDLANILIKE